MFERRSVCLYQGAQFVDGGHTPGVQPNNSLCVPRRLKMTISMPFVIRWVWVNAVDQQEVAAQVEVTVAASHHRSLSGRGHSIVGSAPLAQCAISRPPTSFTKGSCHGGLRRPCAGNPS